MRSEILANRIDTLMIQKPITASPSDLVAAIAEEISHHRIHGVPVIDEERRVVGIITEGDFFVEGRVHLHLPSFVSIIERSLAPGMLTDEDEAMIRSMILTKASDIMVQPCITVTPDATVEETLRLCALTHLKTLPVVDQNSVLIGIVTLTDIISACYQEDGTRSA
jgi:CBS domain-containing protein